MIVLAASGPLSAFAQTCEDGTPVTGGPVCLQISLSGVQTWDCDLSYGGGTGNPTAWVVLDSTGNKYEAFGTLRTGATFCIRIDVTSVDAIQVRGTSGQDTIRARYTPTAAELDAPSTRTLALTVLGGDHDDTIEGSITDNPGNYIETLKGDGGNDGITANGGSDTVFGGAGIDTISGGDEADLLYGDGGADIIDGDDGVDTIEGGDGADTINGGGDSDTIHGNGGDDVIDGDIGDDTIYGDADMDDLSGGDGDDTLFGGSGADVLNGDELDDILYGEGEADILCGGLEAALDKLYGGDGSDTMWGLDAYTNGRGNEGDGGAGSNGCDNNSTGTYANCTLSLTSASWKPGVCH